MTAEYDLPLNEVVVDDLAGAGVITEAERSKLHELLVILERVLATTSVDREETE